MQAITYTAVFGTIGVTITDLSGNELHSFAIAKKQTANLNHNNFFFNKHGIDDWDFRTSGIADYPNMSAFFSYDYIFSNNKDYVIYNDFPENNDEQNEKTKSKNSMITVSAANTMLGYLDADKVGKSFLFGDPGGKDLSRFSQIEMNTLSEDGKTLATLMIERKNKDKQAYIVWVNF